MIIQFQAEIYLGIVRIQDEITHPSHNPITFDYGNLEGLKP